MLRGYPIEVGDEVILWDVNHRSSIRPRVTITKIGRTRVHYANDWGGTDSARMDTGQINDWVHLRTVAEQTDISERVDLWNRAGDRGVGYVRTSTHNSVPLEKLRAIVAILEAE
jgi:hypothetical protein